MTPTAVLMFLVGAIGLWGGFAVAILNYYLKSKAERDSV